ncbi:excinuclease ABC subunit C [bacterium]|nr:excinuclease ABC subunit C [bacterium]
MELTLQEKLEALPKQPGVYLFHDSSGKIIYVGKAKVLRNRVRQYFHSGSDGRPQFEMLVARIADVEVITTATEYEALLLENNLIRKHKPRYNVMLKDDKSQPYLRITNEPFPRVFLTRKIEQDGSKYFGPYSDVHYMRGLVQVLRGMLQIRTCNLPLTEEGVQKGKFKACLEYHIGRCNAPCIAVESKSQYAERLRDFTSVARGKGKEIVGRLRDEMESASDALRFERAAQLRDWLAYVENLSRRQTVLSTEPVDRDIIGVAVQDDDGALVIMQVRGGRLLGRVAYPLKHVLDLPEAEVLENALRLYYAQSTMPDELVLPIEPANSDVLFRWLKEQAESRLDIRVPERGERVQMVDLAKRNAELQLSEILQARVKRERIPASIEELKRHLSLPHLPREICAFDISTLMGEQKVASMVVFKNGKPARSEYRRFKIKSVIGQDDFASMHEVVKRRFGRLVAESGALPDLVLIDGGKGQLGAACQALNEVGVKIPILGLAKKLEEIYLPDEELAHNLPKTSSALRLLQQLRDEAHRFAITYHRHLRDKEAMHSELQDIPGVGPARRKKLLIHFKSMQRLAQAAITEITEVHGISPALAEKIHNFFLDARSNEK